MNTTEMTLNDKAAWLAARRLGSSDAGAALGLNPFKSPYQLWAEKTGRMPGVEENEAMRWGKLLEPVIAFEFGSRNQLEVMCAGSMFTHPKYDWMTATPDYFAESTTEIAGSRAIVECKNVSYFQSERYANDEIPDYVHIQLLHQMCVLGVNVGYVVALLGGNNLVWRKVETDAHEFEWLIRAEKAFWDCVVSDTPPPLRSGDGDVLNAMYPESDSEEITLASPDAIRALEEYAQAKAQMKHHEKIKDESEAKLKALMGASERAICVDSRIIWKTVKSNRVDTKAMEAEHADIVAQFRKPSTSRRFEVKAIKEK